MAFQIPPRVGAASGLAAIVAWVSLYLVAVALYPGYSIVDNYLSDLGHPSLAPGYWAFNAADILAGILFIPYGLAVGSVLRTRLGKVGGAFVVLTGMGLILVGVFPEDSPYGLHFVASLAFFLLLTASAAFLASGGSKLLEHVAVYAGLIWGAWTAVRLQTAVPAPGPISLAPSARPERGPPVP